jgi:23S rRNA (uracil1939-C5)-methyltransferase
VNEPEQLELTAERPAAGGRMVARHDGQVVLVAGAVPGERVRARVERQARQLIWATVTDVLEPSADRRPATSDPGCGGMAYSHIRYERQLALKAEIVADAFRRIGRMTAPGALAIRPSPEHDYRLRARLHVVAGRAVFFREGTHEPCDAASTRQLTPEAIDAVARALGTLGPRLDHIRAIVLAENVQATERVLHFEARDGVRLDDLSGRIDLPDGLAGMTAGARGRPVTLAGRPVVTETADALFGASSPVGSDVTWSRHAAAFFQGNRFLTGDLVRRVLEASSGERVVDLYAGVGLFALALAGRGAEVVAVEGDRLSASDLSVNARPWQGRLHVVRAGVEAVVGNRPDPPPDVVVVDPPRTGVSAEALSGLVSWRAPRLVYVSCDPATLARDAARLATGGYRLATLDGFDLFPNTPHVEVVAVFERAART